MPYKLKKSGKGYKVCKKYGKEKCFSKKPLSKKGAKAQMYAIVKNESLSFEEFFYLSEAMTHGKALSFGTDEKGRGRFGVKGVGGDIFNLKTLIQVLKDAKDNRKELWEFIKFKSHHFSPLLVVLSMMIMGLNTQLYIDQHPEVLKVNPKIVEKAADILNKNPKLLKMFQ